MVLVRAHTTRSNYQMARGSGGQKNGTSGTIKDHVDLGDGHDEDQNMAEDGAQTKFEGK